MKIFTLAAATAILATPVFAADAIVYNEPAPVAVDTFSWTGGYIGLNAGYAGGKFKHPYSSKGYDTVFEEEDNDSGSLDVTSSGFAGGVQAGYNWQFNNNVVAGVEADFQGSNLKGEVKLTDNNLTLKAGTKVNWFGTVRARLGYVPTERLMVYTTGGYAYGKVKSYVDFEGEGVSKSKTKSGWTVGAGAEYALANNWTLKSEYLYTDFGKTKLMNYIDDGVTTKLDAKVKFHTVRVGLNYKF
ncbi:MULTISPECIES: outer membrane protein [Paenochrobactrum]|uniref:outer membrane protein n=1 Tax=Paenochrobactrum pullorum TaxID=1324351 RepID=UPI0035BC8297